jgi:uncharacterized membrane protein
MLQQCTAKQKLSIHIIVGIFGLIFCSISLVNHYLFRTYAFDLGIYNNMLYSYSHFKLNYTPLQQPLVYHAFADHFEPVFFLFAPFYWIFGSYTLLILQIVFVLIGGIGAMRFAQLHSNNNTLSIAILIQFYTMWGVYSALAFDFHNNITAAMIVPWVMVFAQQRKFKPLLICWALILLSKENMALYGIFVCLGLALHYFKDKPLRNLFLLLTAASAVYFVLVVKVIIPSFQQPGAGYLYDSMYKSLGTTPQEILGNVINKPGYLFSLLFENYSGEALFNGIKSELHFSILISGGIFMLYKPQFLVMLIPIYAQKLFNTDAARWGINYHYSIEFVPVLTACTTVFITSINTLNKYKNYLAFLVAVITFYYTFSKMDSRVSIWYDKVNTRFYTADHYTNNETIKTIRHELNALPINNNDAISAQNNLVPHLANRTFLYMYPESNKANSIIVAPKTNLYPLKDSAYTSTLDTLRASKHWQNVTPNNKEVFLFKKRAQ